MALHPHPRYALFLSCEHGGNHIPKNLRTLFHGHEETLRGHRGYDKGALDVARHLSKALDAPLVSATVSRLVVDLNRSLGNRNLYSEFTRILPKAQRDALIAEHYLPYRQAVEQGIETLLAEKDVVIHISVHSFTPAMDGKPRNADIGLLYDPARQSEVTFVTKWLSALRQAMPSARLRRNYPYKGASDGLTTALRRKWDNALYAGIELEINQGLLNDAAERDLLKKALVTTLRASLR